MVVNQDSIINELKLRIRLLEKQTEQPAGRMEERLLLWLVTETIMESNNPEELLKTVLERISVILDVPFSSCYSIHDGKLKMIADYPESEGNQQSNYLLTLSEEVVEVLNESPVFITRGEFEKQGIEINQSILENVQRISIFPFQSLYIPFGIFIFLEESKVKDSLRSVSLVIQHLINLSVEKLEKLNLQQELKDLNYNFESRLKQRADKLSASQKVLPAKEPDESIFVTPEPFVKQDDLAGDLNTKFLRNIGIEVRTPVNGILGFAELIRNDMLSDEQKSHFIDIIQSCGKSLLKVIDDAVDYAYLGSDEIQIHPSEFALTPFLTELYDHFKGDELLNQRDNLELKLNINVNGNVQIRADKARLWQVMVNLIGNSIKFTQEGAIEIGCFIGDQDDAKQTSSNLVFFVKDTGVGIPPEVGNKVFDEFYKIEYEISKLYGGMGLGLSIARSLTNLMGGKIWFETIDTGGTAFYLSFSEVLSDSQQINGTQNGVFFKSDYNWQGKHILIVEDDDMSFVYLREILKSTNVAVLQAKDGNQAVDLARTHPEIDLILMDIKLPGMSGYDATKIIKSFRDVPVIAQTAYAMADDQKRILETGCDEYITKPINRKKLLLTIHKWLDKI